MYYFALMIFSDKGFQAAICNGSHYVVMLSMNFNDIVLLKVNGLNYRRIINGINKIEAIYLLKNENLNEKKWNVINVIFFSSYIKWKKEIITFGDAEIQKGNFHRSRNPAQILITEYLSKCFFVKMILTTLFVLETKTMIKKVNQLCMMLPKMIFQKFWWN